MSVRKIEISLLAGKNDDADLIRFGLAFPWPAEKINLPGVKVVLEVSPSAYLEIDGETNRASYFDMDGPIFSAEMKAKYQQEGFEVVETKTDQLLVKFFSV